jgi:hypothetical protein
MDWACHGLDALDKVNKNPNKYMVILVRTAVSLLFISSMHVPAMLIVTLDDAMPCRWT